LADGMLEIILCITTMYIVVCAYYLIEIYLRQETYFFSLCIKLIPLSVNYYPKNCQVSSVKA